MAQTSPATRRQRVEKGIYKRVTAEGNESFEIGFRDSQGKQRWRRVDGGITAARNKLAEEVAKRARGEQVTADPRLTFNGAADAWWEARATRLRPTTQAVYSSCLVHLRDHFGRQRLTSITAADVAKFVTARQADGAKGWTIKGNLTVLSAIFKHAARHLGFAGANPVSLLDRIERPSLEDERPKRVLSADELQRLIAAVDERHRLIFELAAETGARLGETLGIVWGEIDLEQQTVSLTHQLSRGERVPLKTKRSRRVVEITPTLTKKLRAAKIAAGDSGDHAYVFVTRNGTPFQHRNVAGRVLDRAVRSADLGPIERDGKIVQHAPTFHSLRHSHGSALIAAGWDIQEVADRLGHSDTSVTSRAYIHAYDSARRSEQRRDRLTTLYASDGPHTAEVHRIA